VVEVKTPEYEDVGRSEGIYPCFSDMDLHADERSVSRSCHFNPGIYWTVTRPDLDTVPPPVKNPTPVDEPLNIF
jgi:hypothetical protein